MAEKIFVALTEEELRSRSQTLAQTIHGLAAIEAEKKERVGEFNSEIKEMKAKIIELATAIRSGHEERDADELPGITRLRDKIA